MKHLLFSLSILTLFLTSCVEEAQEVHPTSNPNIQVEVLFEKDGCTVYRFSDCGHKVYWCDCRGTVQYDTGGKSSQHIEVPTMMETPMKY